MSGTMVQLSEKQVVGALAKFSPKELKRVIDSLFKEKLYKPPTLASITREASKIVKKELLSSKTVEDAVKWSRAQKSS